MQTHNKDPDNICPLGNGEEESDCRPDTSTQLNISSSDVSAMFQIAMSFHHTGRLQEADAVYQRILEIEPNNYNALHLLGLVAHQADLRDIAVDLINRAIKIKPTAVMFYNIGIIFQEQGIQNDAITSYKTAISMNPDYAEAYGNLGAVLHAQRQQKEAIQYYRKAISIRPNDLGAYYNLGSALQDIGDDSAASQVFANSVRISENILSENPKNAHIYNNLGKIFSYQSEFQQAERNFRIAISIDPNFSEVYNNLGNVLANLEQFENAIELFQHAQSIKPNYYEALLNESLSLLSLGQLQAGWDKYEYRLLQIGNIEDSRKFSQSRYNGEDISNKTILVWSEQGIGDEIRFANTLPDVIEKSGSCIIECNEKLVSLFTRSFPSALIVAKTIPANVRTQHSDIDFQIPAGSIPRLFRRSIESFPNHNSYLVADRERVSFWKDRLRNLGNGIKVGICWRSMRQSSNRSLHYTELTQWKSILNVAGVIFVNLQYDDCIEEISDIKKRYGINIHTWDDIDLLDDLDDTAALTTALDLVISPATSVFAMAGALGSPCWKMGRQGDKESFGTANIPWYPSSRLFSKNINESWDIILEKIADELQVLGRSNENI